MGANNESKWYVHCPVCGAYLIKSSVSNSEVECRKCHNTISVLVRDGMVAVYETDEHGEDAMRGRIAVYHEKVGKAIRND